MCWVLLSPPVSTTDFRSALKWRSYSRLSHCRRHRSALSVEDKARVSLGPILVKRRVCPFSSQGTVLLSGAKTIASSKSQVAPDAGPSRTKIRDIYAQIRDVYHQRALRERRRRLLEVALLLAKKRLASIRVCVSALCVSPRFWPRTGGEISGAFPGKDLWADTHLG